MKLVGTDATRYYAWDLEPGIYSIGRKSDCDLVINDKTVSRKHAELEITADNGKVILTDLGSHNGTLVRGDRLQGKVEVHAGDYIQFGQTEFKLTMDETPQAPGSPKPALAALSGMDPEKSVMLSMAEALRPLPTRVTGRPDILPTLFDMAKMLVLPEPQEVMLNRSLELVSKVIPSDRLAVLFTSEDDDGGIYTGASLLPGGKEMGDFHLSQTIVNQILSEKNAILISDAKEDPRFASQQSIIMSEMKSAMAVPLFDEEKVLGILYADTTNPMYRYSDDSLRLFATVGNIIASRLSNYVLLQERQAKQVYEAEAQRASNIQKTLLPRSVPKIPGYSITAFQEQCLEVGGDLYDVAILPNGCLMFLIADVSGKGMGAALLMSHILASFRILYDDEHFNLSRAVKKVSDQLHAHSGSENFATLFIGIVNPHDHKLTYINAGHNPPLLVRESGKLEHLDPQGTMIGAFDFSSWEPDTVVFHPGDFLVTFTDGVTEAGIEDEEYSDERLEALVVAKRGESPSSLARIIVDDVDSVTRGTTRSDDITMVILKRDE